MTLMHHHMNKYLLGENINKLMNSRALVKLYHLKIKFIFACKTNQICQIVVVKNFNPGS